MNVLKWHVQNTNSSWTSQSGMFKTLIQQLMNFPEWYVQNTDSTAHELPTVTCTKHRLNSSCIQQPAVHSTAHARVVKICIRFTWHICPNDHPGTNGRFLAQEVGCAHSRMGYTVAWSRMDPTQNPIKNHIRRKIRRVRPRSAFSREVLHSISSKLSGNKNTKNTSQTTR